MLGAGKTGEDVEPKKKDAVGRPVEDYVHEKVAEPILKQWKADDDGIEKYKAVQKEQEGKHEPDKPSNNKGQDAPKAKAMPLRMEKVGSMEVTAGTLELFARLVPNKKPCLGPEVAKTTQEPIDVDLAESKTPTPPDGPPPFLRNITAPPPPVPVWRHERGDQQLGYI